jgi:DNA-binding GntR family transcriptional regulator
MPIPQDFIAPLHMSAKERALEQIRRWIVDGTLAAGEKLSDADLAQAMGMSRTPVREALQALDQEGLVEIRAGRLTRVTQVDPAAIGQVYPLLAALESVAASSAAAVIDANSLEQLRAINEQLREAIRRRDAYRTLEADEQFHGLIVEAAQNSYLTPLAATLHSHLRRLQYAFFRDASFLVASSVLEHEAIIEALAARAGADAARWMQQNWLRPMEEMDVFWAAHSEEEAD